MFQGIGLQGSSYALPTKGVNISFMPLETIGKHVDEFISFAKNHPNLTFRVTRVGCGLAGFKDTEIAPLFRDALELPNVRLPKGWRHYITTGEVVPFHDEAEDEPAPITFEQALVETKKSIGRFKDFLAKPIE